MTQTDHLGNEIVRLSGAEVRSQMLAVLANNRATSQAVHALRMERQCTASKKRPTEHVMLLPLSWKGLRFLLVQGKLKLSLLPSRQEAEIRHLFAALKDYLLLKLKEEKPAVVVATLPQDWMAEVLNRECWQELQVPWFEKDAIQTLRDIGEIRTLLALKKVKVFFQSMKYRKPCPKALNYLVYSLKTVGIAARPLEKQTLEGLFLALPDGFHVTQYLGRLPGWKGRKNI